MSPDHIHPRRARASLFGVVLPVVMMLVVIGCTPTVKVEAPTEPITINLNVKLDADIRLKLEEKAEEDVENNPIF